MTPLRTYPNFILSFLLLLFIFSSCSRRSGKPKILVFSKTAGYHHESISDGMAALTKLGAENNFDVDTTTNPSFFNQDSLEKYSAVVFLSTTGDVLNNYQEAEFERYIQAGGGYAGIHAAADTEYEWGWYGRLVGGYFFDHPGINDTFPNVQPGILNVLDKGHISTSHLTDQWKKTDEFYSYKKLNKDVKVLVTLDEKSYQGGHKMGEHPMAWYHEFDGGRAFYTALGHTSESYAEEAFLKHVLGGIQYAIGDNDKLDYSDAKTLSVPEENRFTKTALVNGQLFEPTEMTVLPNLDILVAQRRGEIMLYKNGDSVLKKAGFLNVYFKTSTPDVNAEEGVLGIKADPNFAKNHYIYIFYSPADTSVNRLSRFKYENDQLDLKSEKVILQFFSQREICCHTGGSIAFDKEGLLYLSTGDNSTPFNAPGQRYVNSGYAPLNATPGFEQYDARRTSGNANDLRGKILRIRVKEDGSYEIPEGNLYPKSAQGSRPEVYVQGNRNPYRISIDQKNNFLYWGEVGPDANADSLELRGPRGYDEVNQARKAGFFGWPFFIGNNYAYHDYDYSTGKSGPTFDPSKPVNNSKNNTGIKNLPPAQPAFIWYPYGASADFPQVGTGGRNAMTGPVYYTDMFDKETRLPDYYNNKLFIYDWMRGWIKAVTMQPNGDFDKMEPFMEHTKLNGLIDMEVGPDGKLYLLEYGSGWFSQNADAGLSRIDFNGGNRSPKIAALKTDKTSGGLPLKVVASVEATDPENDKLSYVWHLGNGVKKETSEPRLEYTYSKKGDYAIKVEVKDEAGASTVSKPVSVYAGNEQPIVDIKINGNQVFYFANTPVQYRVSVTDKDDASASQDQQGIFVSADYVEGSDKAEASQGHQVMSQAMVGRSLVMSLDCKACHKETQKSIGPSYFQVAERYRNDKNAVPYLVNKIKKGGSGVWGETAMAAHPDLKEEDARKIVAWIQTLAEGGQSKKSLPVQGSVHPTFNKTLTDNGVLLISSSYTDKGGPGIKPLTGSSTVSLRNSKVNLNVAGELEQYTKVNFNNTDFLMVPKVSGTFALSKIDLTGIQAVDLAAMWQKAPLSDYSFEVRLDSPTGKKVGSATLAAASLAKPVDGVGGTTIRIKLQPVTNGKLHTLYFVSRASKADDPNSMVLQSAQFRTK